MFSPITLTFVAAIIASAAVAAPPPPVWASGFSVLINQTIHLPSVDHNNLVLFYYDAAHNQSKEVHGKGQYDEYCRSVEGKKDSDEPCTHLVANSKTEGIWRYLIFPESNYCCKCCDAAHYCSIISPDWLRNATYQGTKMVGKYNCEGWMKQGGEKNFYYQTIEPNPRPCLYYEGYPVLPYTSNTWLYLTDSYIEAPQDQALFAIPPNCDARCKSNTCDVASKKH